MGGTPTVVGAYPSHVVVVVNNTGQGGTILNANHVLTSCGVVLTTQNELVPVNAVIIRAGAVTFTGGTPNTVVAIFPHPEYNPWTRNHDVAVLRTGSNFVFNELVPNPPIAPAILNDRIIGDTTTCVVVGFLPTAANLNPTLQTLIQDILNRDTQCNAVDVHNGRVLETMICAGSALPGQGICDRTRGGGLYCNGILTGVASDGLGCGIINSPGVYAQVRDYIQWINAQFNRTQIPAPGSTPPPGVIISAAPAAPAATAIVSTFLLCTSFLLTKL